MLAKTAVHHYSGSETSRSRPAPWQRMIAGTSRAIARRCARRAFWLALWCGVTECAACGGRRARPLRAAEGGAWAEARPVGAAAAEEAGVAFADRRSGADSSSTRGGTSPAWLLQRASGCRAGSRLARRAGDGSGPAAWHWLAWLSTAPRRLLGLAHRTRPGPVIAPPLRLTMRAHSSATTSRSAPLRQDVPPPCSPSGCQRSDIIRSTRRLHKPCRTLGVGIGFV